VNSQKAAIAIRPFVFQDDNQSNDGLFHHKPIDLEKLFTPASDSGEATPSRNSKFLGSKLENFTL
jgi:hypothetical protein